ncbi:MAG TPA: Trm112 family protein, partial [Thermoanaerobaculia bacterium]
MSVESGLLALLACPRDHGPLAEVDDGSSLACPAGHRYAIVDGFPVLLRDDVPQTHWAATMALAEARGEGDPNAATAWVGREGLTEGEIDPWVQAAIGATGGHLYGPLIDRLTDYPVPRLPAPPGE